MDEDVVQAGYACGRLLERDRVAHVVGELPAGLGGGRRTAAVVAGTGADAQDGERDGKHHDPGYEEGTGLRHENDVNHQHRRTKCEIMTSDWCSEAGWFGCRSGSGQAGKV